MSHLNNQVQPLTRQEINSYYAQRAHEQAAANPETDIQPSAYESDRARNSAVSTELIVQFMKVFKMDARQAKAVVEREMRRKYAPNPWDAPTWRDREPRRELRVEVEKEEPSPVVVAPTEYSKEQWDHFERNFA